MIKMVILFMMDLVLGLTQHIHSQHTKELILLHGTSGSFQQELLQKLL